MFNEFVAKQDLSEEFPEEKMQRLNESIDAADYDNEDDERPLGDYDIDDDTIAEKEVRKVFQKIIMLKLL